MEFLSIASRCVFSRISAKRQWQLQPQSRRQLGHWRVRPQSRGVALVIVLASLAFLTLLAVAFVASVTTELKSSRRFADGISTQMLANTTFSLATAQITEATKGYPGSDMTTTLAWASQPGMIRTFNDSGAKTGFYRLYSWDTLTGSGSYTPDDLTGWFNQKAIFVDLNEPITVDNKARYPIVNGNLQDVLLPAAGGAVKTYDSDSDSVPDIDGFYVKGAPANTVSGSNAVPMPVKWLYVLADGKILAPTVAGAGEAKVTGASLTNPIVGRIAFWTDDETCKLNINTAAEGSYGDIPRFNSSFDYGNLSDNQATANEYQRYPGHPAMTSLSTVLKKPATPVMTDAQWAEEIYKIVPRVTEGGSKSATVMTSQVSATAPSPIYPDSDRLFASIDELFFRPTMSGTSRQEAFPTVLNRDSLERDRFFLTASSRAPDLNLFNKPRVCMWPIHLTNDDKHRTAFDQLIAYCASINDFAYYFQRSDQKSARTDLPVAPTTTGLGRNRMLLDYLRDLTGRSIPGFGGNFLAKYPGAGGVTDRDQILTEMFDYIRSVNLRDARSKDVPTFVTFAPPLSGTNSGSGEVVPIEDPVTNTRGFGRFPTVDKAFLVFVGQANNSTNSAIPVGKIRVQAGFFLSMMDPSQGMVPGYPRLKIRVTGLDSFTWGETAATRVPMGFPATATSGSPYDVAFGSENFVGGVVGWATLVYSKGYNDSKKWPFVSTTIDLPAGAGQTFSFGGGNPKIEILGVDTNDVIQTLTLEFPATTTTTTQFPVPSLAPATIPDTNGANMRYFTFGGTGGRLNLSGGGAAYSGNAFIISEDTVRSVEAKPGDSRLIAARVNVLPTHNLFGPHAYYFNSAKKKAHSLRTSQGLVYNGATGGRLANVISPTYLGYSAEYTGNGVGPLYAMTANYVKDWGNTSTTGVAAGKSTNYVSTDVPGDWDNGFGNLPDGPYINKADEGDFGSSSQNPYYGDLRYTRVATSLFSPNRQIPSAVTFGSLPTGVIANKPWLTLLFRPAPAKHDGLGLPVNTPVGPPYTTPPDHLFLDLFHMPVVEPYAISEPLSTAGRINMNCRIVPFTYINRDTGLRSVLKTEKVIAVPDANANNYKSYAGTLTSTALRSDIDLDETLKGFTQRFDAQDIFRSSSEICSIHLVPKGTTYAGMSTYWSTRKLTGDNSRERPYAGIYPRLTTKSNTFTIYARVQSLTKVKGSTPDIWTEGKDIVNAEYRGYQTIERYIDPKDSTLYDYADTVIDAPPISQYYKTRVIASKQFAP